MTTHTLIKSFNAGDNQAFFACKELKCRHDEDMMFASASLLGTELQTPRQ
jgi:hypothetical protein